MIVSSLKVKVVRKPVLKVRVLPRIPANLVGDIAISVTKDGATYTIAPDYSGLAELTTFDPSQQLVLVHNRDGTWAIVPASTLVNNPLAAVRVVAEAGDITVAAATRVLVMNRTVNASPSRIYMPDSDAKIGDLLVVDWKGNSGTFPHDVYTVGSDKLNGNLSSWQIGADSASVRFSPIPNLGYAV